MNPVETTPAEAIEIDSYFCEIPSDACAIVMFGASGDLARRKLLPALYDLASHACLAPRFRVIGFARSEMDDNAFRQSSSQFLPKVDKAPAPNGCTTDDFLKHLQYFRGNYDNHADYQRLKEVLDHCDKDSRLSGNRLFYLATPPEVYPIIIEQLGRAGLAKPGSDGSWVRVIIEKPFGRNLETARELNRQVLSVFDESQVYRIDHYLGKETVQNLVVFRFSNGIFEPLWNRRYFDHVQITAIETLGVENRAAFYETAGALRDMIQSHVLQLTSLVAVEPPARFEATALRNEKIKVLQSIRPFTPQSIAKSVVRGQYGPGTIGGKPVPAYRSEPGVSPNSQTETYVALKLFVDNWRWSGVPFYLRTAKRASRPLTEIAIQFHQAPHLIFQGASLQPNWLVLNIQPDEGISLSFGAKEPGTHMNIRPVTMDFRYRTAFRVGTRDAYATLINDCIRGDATLFDRADSVEAAWALVDPILEYWEKTPATGFPNYAAGSAGPKTADELLASDGREWRPL